MSTPAAPKDPIPDKASSLPPIDPEEQLARFREEWRAEVRGKQALAHGHSAIPDAQAESSSQLTSDKGKEPAANTARVFQEVARLPSKVSSTSGSGGTAGVVRLELLPNQLNALEVYRQAIACEQSGELDEALRLYRKAFRVADDVDKIYTHLERIQVKQQQLELSLDSVASGQLKSSQHASSTTGPKSQDRGGDAEHLAHSLGNLDLAAKPVAVVPVTSWNITGTLASLISQWDNRLAFLPEEGREREPVLIAKIPDEILVHILSTLDVKSLETFAAVSRKARVVSLDSSIWRAFVQEIYQPPQIRPDEDISTLLGDYHLDHRRMFMEHPRIRLDGVYIAVLHYT